MSDEEFRERINRLYGGPRAQAPRPDDDKYEAYWAEREAREEAAKRAKHEYLVADVTDRDPIGFAKPNVAAGSYEWLAWSRRYAGVMAWAADKASAIAAVAQYERQFANYRRRTAPTGAEVLAVFVALGWERRLDLLGEPHVYSCPERPDLVWAIPDERLVTPPALAALAEQTGVELADIEDMLGITATKLSSMAQASDSVAVHEATRRAADAQAAAIAAKAREKELEAAAEKASRAAREARSTAAAEQAERQREYVAAREAAEARARRRGAA